MHATAITSRDGNVSSPPPTALSTGSRLPPPPRVATAAACLQAAGSHPANPTMVARG